MEKENSRISKKKKKVKDEMTKRRPKKNDT
jgi:hypothetical protein